MMRANTTMTTNAAAELDDGTFLEQFENKTLAPVHFNHLGHLRICWLYLTQHDRRTAHQLVCSGIKAYAESLGADKKFHLTITHSLVTIMAKRINRMEVLDWLLFPAENPDLVEDALSVLLSHFSKDVLFSDAARTSLLKPDLKPLL